MRQKTWSGQAQLERGQPKRSQQPALMSSLMMASTDLGVGIAALAC